MGAAREEPGGCRYLARQPILDRRACVHAYELLSRSGPAPAPAAEGELATEIMIDNSLLFGLQSLTCGSPAFINCSSETLLDGSVRVLPAGMTVLEIREDLPADADVVACCRQLKAEGYRLALDDLALRALAPRAELEPLIRMADFIKMDFLGTSAGERREMRQQLRSFTGALIAEKVETRESYGEACAEGFELFQGYYFCRPLLLKEQKVPANHAVHLRLLEMLHKDPLDLVEIDEAVKSEPALTYRLLRYVNSPVYGLRDRITSIRSALIAVGDDLFRRIVLLAVASDFSKSGSSEVLRLALVRARFLESTAVVCNLHPTEQYLLGLFSLLPAMLHRPMAQAIAGLPLREPLRDALLGDANALRRPLEWMEAYERGEFDRSDALARAHGMNPVLLGERFTDAAMWADLLMAE